MSTRTTRVVYDLFARDRASRTFVRVGDAANHLAGQSRGVGAAIAAGFKVGAVATAALGASVIKMAGDFEKNMNRVEALSGATGANLKKLRDQAKELGRTTQYSAAQTAHAMGQLATAGLNVNQIYGAMPSVLALASSEQLDVTRAAEVATSVMTGYGMTVREIPHAVDALVKASVRANTSVDDLGEAFKYAGPIAHLAGVQFEETVAGMALMGNAGIKASMAGTALRGAVTRLLAPTAKISKTLKGLGVEVATSDGKLRPLVTIVADLAKKGAKTGDIMTIFGQRAGPGMAALVQQGSDKLARLTKELENSGGTAKRIADIQMKGWRGELIRLKNAWEGLMIEIADTGVLKAATGALEGVTSSLRGLTGVVDKYAVPAFSAVRDGFTDLVPVEDIKTKFSEAGTAVADFFSGLTGKSAKQRAALPIEFGAVADPSGSVKVGEQIRDAISGGVGDIDWGQLGAKLGEGLSSAIGWVGQHAADLTKQVTAALAKIDFVDVGKSFGSMAIPLAVGFITNLFQPLFTVKFWKEHWLDLIIAVISIVPIGRLAGVFGKLLAKIPFLKVFAPLMGKLAGAGKFVEKGLGKVFGFIPRALASGFMKGLERVFPGLGATLARKAGDLVLKLFTLWGRFGAAGLRLLEGLKGGITKGAEGLGSVLGHVTGLIVKPFARAGGWLIAKGTAVVSGLKSGITAGARAVGGWVKTTVINPITSRFSAAGSWLVARGSALINGLKAGVTSAITGVRAWLTARVVTPITSRFAAARTWLTTSGSQLISGLFAGITAKMVGVGQWIKRTIVDPIVNAVKSFFGIHSPSRVFHGIGTNLVAGLVGGLASTSGAAIAKKIFGDMPHALGHIVKKGLVAIGSLPGKALDALQGLGGAFADLLGDAGGAIGLGSSGASGNAQRYAQIAMRKYGWGPGDWGALKQLWQAESGWNPLAHNPSSGAHGIPQALPASKMASAGADYMTNPVTQINWGLSYIKGRYGSPSAAWSFWRRQSPHWYASGTDGAAAGWAWVGERGPELVRFSGGEQVVDSRTSMAMARSGLPGYASGTAKAAVRGDLADVLRQLTHGADVIRTAMKELATDLRQLGAKGKFWSHRVAQNSDRLADLSKKSQALADRIKEAREFAGTVTTGARDFAGLSSVPSTSGTDIAKGLKGKLNTIKKFASLIKQLGSRGLSKGLLRQIIEMGPEEGLAYAQALIAADADTFRGINTAQSGIDRAAKALGNSAADLLYDSGKQAGKGFLKGLEAQREGIAKLMLQIAKSMQAAIKKALGIKSPSAVFAGFGEQTTRGLAVGMIRAMPHLDGALQQVTNRVASARPALAPAPPRPAAYRPVPAQAVAAGPMGPVEMTGTLVLDSGELMGTFRGVAQPMIRASEQRQARQARHGKAAMR